MNLNELNNVFQLNIKLKKAGLMLTFWLTLRQFVSEKRLEKRLNESSPDIPIFGSDNFSSNVSNPAQINSKIISWVYLCLVKYWIFLSSGMLLLMSCQSPVVAFRIGYMILFLYFITTFQVMFS